LRTELLKLTLKNIGLILNSLINRIKSLNSIHKICVVLLFKLIRLLIKKKGSLVVIISRRYGNLLKLVLDALIIKACLHLFLSSVVRHRPSATEAASETAAEQKKH
jgi:large-conductance mechanosensitive channel